MNNTPFENAWNLLKQYDPLEPAHIQSQVFPEMSSRTKFMSVPGGKLGHTGQKSRYGGYSLQDVGVPFEVSPATTRLLMPHEQEERTVADRNQAMERANQFHQDRIDAMQNLPEPTTSFSQGGPDFNPFQPVDSNNLDDPRNEQNPFHSPSLSEQAKRERIEQIARDAVLQHPLFRFDNPENMDSQGQSLFNASVRNMIGLLEQSHALPMRITESGGE